MNHQCKFHKRQNIHSNLNICFFRADLFKQIALFQIVQLDNLEFQHIQLAFLKKKLAFICKLKTSTPQKSFRQSFFLKFSEK